MNKSNDEKGNNQGVRLSKGRPIQAMEDPSSSPSLGVDANPEMSIEQAIAVYKRLGYSDQWMNQRHPPLRFPIRIHKLRRKVIV